MLNWIIDFSLRHRLLVVLGVVTLAVIGGLSLRYLDIDAFPDTTPVQVQINTVAPSLGPGGGRAADHLPDRAGARRPARPGERCGRVSKFGLSQVVVTFEDGTDIYFARQLVNERLATVELPAGIERPKMGPVATGLGEVFHYVVTGQGRRRHRAADDPRLGHQAQDAHGARARPRSTAGAATRSSTRCASIPNLLIKYGLTFDEVVAGRRREQPQRRRRQHPRRDADRCSSRARPHGERRADQGHRHHGHGRRADPRRRRGRGGDRLTRSAAARSRPTARAKSSSAWASCSWARTATTSPGP